VATPNSTNGQKVDIMKLDSRTLLQERSTTLLRAASIAQRIADAHRAYAKELIARGDPGGAVPFRGFAEGAEQVAAALALYLLSGEDGLP
jgi:hypothetical protein